MTLYTHEVMDGLFGNTAFQLPDGRQFPRVWWRTATKEEISDLGFVEHIPTKPEPGPPQYPIFTALEMLDLFTEAEQRTVKQAAMQDVDVGLWYDRMLAADYVTYEDPRTEAGLQALVDAELITPSRKAAIVAAMQPEG